MKINIEKVGKKLFLKNGFFFIYWRYIMDYWLSFDIKMRKKFSTKIARCCHKERYQIDLEKSFTTNRNLT